MNKKNVVITEIDVQYATLAVEVGISESDLVAALATTQTLGDACRVALEAKGL